jgi:hypothetical protein|nr:MAG TPA_asm: protein of unknown function (DUF5052) [Caudoviricetes sp.]
MNKLYKLLMVGMISISLFGCASVDRWCTDVKSDLNGGLNRIINVYTADGKVLASYEGRIDIEINDGGYVKFDYDGKRYIYYNCYVETIADK